MQKLQGFKVLLVDNPKPTQQHDVHGLTILGIDMYKLFKVFRVVGFSIIYSYVLKTWTMF